MRAVGRTGAVFAAGVGSMQTKAKADTNEDTTWVKLERPSKTREIFTGKSKTITFDSDSEKKSRSPARSISHSPPFRPQVPGEITQTHSRSPHVSPSLSPAASDSALLQPLERLVPLVPRNMKVQSFLQETWHCAEELAKDPAIRNAIQGSSRFQKFEEHMRRSWSAPVNLHISCISENSQLEQIEGGPAGPVRREPGSPETESSNEGETESPEGEFMTSLRQLLAPVIAMPVSVLYKALSWFGLFSIQELEEGEGDLKEEEESMTMAYTSLMTACLMLILLYRKRFR